MKKRLFLLSLLVIASLMLNACNLPAAVQEGWKGFSEGWNMPKPVDPETQAAIDAAVKEALEKVGITSAPEVAEPKEELPAPAATTRPTISTNWFVADVPLKVVTIKPADPDSGMPSVVAHMFGPAGVLGADKLADADANKSAVWTGSAVYHRAPDTAEFGFLGPEGSYSTIYAKQFGKIVLGDPKDPMFILSIPDCGPHCAQGILIRSPFAEDGKDNHLPIWVEDYGAIGAASFTRYAVEPNWARVFSEGYWTDQAKNALVFDNNGIGNKDTNVFIGHVIDVNDGSYTVLKYTASEGWTVLWTNVVGHASN